MCVLMFAVYWNKIARLLNLDCIEISQLPLVFFFFFFGSLKFIVIFMNIDIVHLRIAFKHTVTRGTYMKIWMMIVPLAHLLAARRVGRYPRFLFLTPQSTL